MNKEIKEKTRKEKTKPEYLKIYAKIKKGIIDGAYPFGSKLPSKRLLAAENNLSTVTIEHAYCLLCDEGYAEAKERSGFFVIFKSSDGFIMSSEPETVSYDKQKTRTYPDFPFSVLSKTMRAVLTDYAEAVLEKSPNSGHDQLKNALKLYLARNRGIQIGAEQIIIGSGAEYLYGLIIELLGRNRIYGIEQPSYKKIEQVYTAEDVKCDFLKLGKDGIESSALLNTKASVLHTTPYRSFPTGITASATKRHEYIRWAEKGDRVIIEDDFESEFSVLSKSEETLFALSKSDNVIYLNTFSKTISPSLRIGYMVLPKKFLPLFKEKLGFYACTVPTFEQLVLAKLLNDGDFERHINRVRRKLRKELAESKQ